MPVNKLFFGNLSGGIVRNPEKDGKCRDEVGEDAVQRIGIRMRMPVNSSKYRDAEPDRQQVHDDPGYRYRNINDSCFFKPVCFHFF